MGKLGDWANEQSPFLRIGDGEYIVGEYVGFEEIPNRFDPKMKSMRYTFLMNGQQKFFESSSANVARQFDKIEDGKLVKIEREGEGNKTRYTITEVMDEKGTVSKKAKEQIEQDLAD